MTGKQKALVWGMGILIWINLQSVFLSAWQFGYVDWTTVARMGMIALPPLVVAALLLYRFRVVTEDRRVEAPPPARVSGTHATVEARR
ncbi:MAG: hypothetical protein ACE5JQ_10280 [Candidatus Methylomirabilales bacterium]